MGFRPWKDCEEADVRNQWPSGGCSAQSGTVSADTYSIRPFGAGTKPTALPTAGNAVVFLPQVTVVISAL